MKFVIKRKEKLTSNIFLMEVTAEWVARSAKPGQFVIVIIDDKGERIPLTICDYDPVKGTIVLVFQVVGKSKAVTVFTPLTEKEFEKNKFLWNKFEDARNLFYQGEIENAKSNFEKIAQEFNFTLAQKYFEKCNSIKLPIEENLKGIWIATEK